MLSTALVTGLGLAIYALTASATSQNQLIAVNLAREGIDVVRMMRDSNWLAGDVAGGTWDLQVCPGAPLDGKVCYPRVYDGPTYDLNPTDSYQTYSTGISYTPASRSFSFTAGYLLYLQADGTYSPTPNGASNFSRKLVLSYITTGAYSAQYPALAVKSIVGWRAKNCSEMTDNDPETTNCKVVVEERLTNWKDYK